jgi:phage shock protein A
MAGFLKRVRRLTLARINAFLDALENPEQVFPQLVRELRQECRRAVEAEATAVAALRRRQQEHDEAKAEAETWTRRAEVAVKGADDALARAAIEKQMAAEKRLPEFQEAVQAARVAADRAREAREQLHSRVATLERRRDEILARARAAAKNEDLQRVFAHLESGWGTSLLDAVARMEDQVAIAEARAGAYAELAGGDAEARFRELERRRAIEDRLAELKQKVVMTPEAGLAEPEAAR